MARILEGDKVVVDDPKFPGVWTVTKVNPKTYAMTPDGGGRGLRAPHSMVRPASEGAIATVVAFRSPYVLGALVRYTGPSNAKIRTGELHVVLKDDGGDRIRTAKLGGDGDRYWRLPPRHLAEVPVSEVVR